MHTETFFQQWGKGSWEMEPHGAGGEMFVFRSHGLAGT